MKINEILTEMPDQKAIAKLKQDAAQLKAMKDSGNMDLNKAMPMMQNMATMAAKADMGSKLLVFFEKMASAIKKGIDTNVYGPADLPTMQKAYDGIMAQMPQLQKMAADSKALALKYGRTDREKASLDDKGNYKGTNIKPTAQQAQSLARTEQQVGETATSGATSSASIASTTNGFANGGPGTLTRMGNTKKKKKKKVEGKSPHKKGTKKYKAHMAAMHAG